MVLGGDVSHNLNEVTGCPPRHGVRVSGSRELREGSSRVARDNERLSPQEARLGVIAGDLRLQQPQCFIRRCGRSIDERQDPGSQALPALTLRLWQVDCRTVGGESRIVANGCTQHESHLVEVAERYDFLQTGSQLMTGPCAGRLTWWDTAGGAHCGQERCVRVIRRTHAGYQPAKQSSKAGLHQRQVQVASPWPWATLAQGGNAVDPVELVVARIDHDEIGPQVGNCLRDYPGDGKTGQ